MFDEYSFNADLYVGYDPNEGSLADGMKWIVGNGYDREKDNFDEITGFSYSTNTTSYGIPAAAGNRHYESIKSLYDAGKLQILEPGEQPKFSDIAQDYLNIDGQNLYTDFEWSEYFEETRQSSIDNVTDIKLRSQ